MRQHTITTSFGRFTTYLALLMLVLAGAGTALAQGLPANDSILNATVIEPPLFVSAIDTSEATSDANDPYCDGSGYSVWYVYSADTDVYVDANTYYSGYDTTISVYTGAPGALEPILCSNDYMSESVSFRAQPGKTYYFMVASAFDSPGSWLNFTVKITQPFQSGVTLDPIGRFDPRTGMATIGGTITCNTEADFVTLDMSLRQSVGRIGTIQASRYESVNCTPDGPTPWSFTLLPQQGKFAGGQAFAQVHLYGCNSVSCAATTLTAMIRLRR